MNDSAWAWVLMATLAVLIAVGFVAIWVWDQGRAREQATDTERRDTAPHHDAPSRDGAAEDPHDIHHDTH